MREFWREEGFLELHSPKLMGSASESGAELFKVEYFERQAYLAQSPQFYKQMAMAAGFGKVFEVGPVFRANPSFTSRHDTEFTSVDMEFSWIDSHEDVMAFEERVAGARSSLPSGAPTASRSPRRSARRWSFRRCRSRVTPGRAKEMVHEGGHEAPGPGHDLDPPSERALSAADLGAAGPRVRLRHRLPGGGPPLLPHAPRRRPDADKELRPALAGHRADTGAQREHRSSSLLAQALDKGVEVGPIQFYLDFFRFGARRTAVSDSG